MNATTINVNYDAATFKQFCTDNGHLAITEAQQLWRKHRQEVNDKLKVQFDTGIKGESSYRQLGRVGLSGVNAGLVRVAEVRLTKASAEQIRSQRAKDVESNAKRDAKYALLLSEV